MEADGDFRWRGGNVSRLEGLSDGVFALAVALIAIQTEFPNNHAELVLVLRELPASAVCFVFVSWCWYYHYKFFRRFGAQDMLTILLNGALLMLVLFFVYPLRFLASVLISGPLFYGGYGKGPEGTMTANNGLGTFVFYATTFAAIFALLALMNWNAWRHRDALGLTALERFLTLFDVRVHLISVASGLLAVLLAVITHPAVGGFSFFLLGPAQAIHGFWSGRRYDRLRQRVAGAAGAGAG